MTLDRSPEIFFKTSYLYVSIKTDPALVNPWWPRALFGANLNTVYPLGDIRNLDLVVSN